MPQTGSFAVTAEGLLSGNSRCSPEVALCPLLANAIYWSLPFVELIQSLHERGDFSMTQVDVLFRYGVPPSESVMSAYAQLSNVYGIRRLQLNDAQKTIRVEYDATRLTRAVVANLLRRGGVSVFEEVPLVAPQNPIEHPDGSQPPAPIK